MKSEYDVSQDIYLLSPKHNMRLYRNNYGALLDATGRLVRYGLGHVSKIVNRKRRSVDYVGFKTIEIKPHHVGSKLAIFTAIEVKKEDWNFKGTDKEKAQLYFIDEVIKGGGIAGFVSNIESFENIVKNV